MSSMAIAPNGRPPSDQISEELGAVRRAMEQQRARIESEPKKWTKEQRDAGARQGRPPPHACNWIPGATRSALTRPTWPHSSKLLTLEPNDFDRRRLAADDLIPKRAMGDPNSVYDLENYVVGTRRRRLGSRA